MFENESCGFAGSEKQGRSGGYCVGAGVLRVSNLSDDIENDLN